MPSNKETKRIDPLTKEERIEIRKWIEATKYRDYIELQKEDHVEVTRNICKILGVPASPLQVYSDEAQKVLNAIVGYYLEGKNSSFKAFLDKLDDIKRDYQIKKLVE
jgi:hypothetical protein